MKFIPSDHFSPYQNDEDSLHREIERVKMDMENAYLNFQYAVDPDLIDCCIYECNAAWKRYRFLLKQVKMQGTHK